MKSIFVAIGKFLFSCAAAVRTMRWAKPILHSTHYCSAALQPAGDPGKIEIKIKLKVKPGILPSPSDRRSGAGNLSHSNC